MKRAKALIIVAKSVKSALYGVANTLNIIYIQEASCHVNFTFVVGDPFVNTSRIISLSVLASL